MARAASAETPRRFGDLRVHALPVPGGAEH